VTIDDAGLIDTFNHSAQTLFGYSEQEVGTILDRQQALLTAVAPSGSSDRAIFYRGQAVELADLRVALSALEVRQLDLIRRATATRLNGLVDELSQDSKLGVDPADLAPLQLHVESLQTSLNYARSPADFRRAFAEMGTPIDQAQQLRAARAADLAAVQVEADRLKQVTAGNLDALRQVGLQAVADGRNYASGKAYLRLAPGRSYDLIESDAARLDGQAVDDVALAAALLERYRDELHSQLIAGITAGELAGGGLECQCICPMCSIGACGCVSLATATVNEARRETAPGGEPPPGFLLQRPRPASQLAVAGVHGGDRLLKVDGQQVQSIGETQAAIRKHGIGEEIRLLVQHESEEPREIRVEHVRDYPQT